MLILGGAGRLTGALVGTAIFMVLHHTASSINPYHWLFIVGGLLMFVVLAPPAKAVAWLRTRFGGAK
jgi:branched-chain amino acid transport system permease protein